MLELFKEFNIKSFIIFFIFNLIYVILNTIKNISSVKSNPRDKKAKAKSSRISTVCYMWYTIILKQIAQIDLLSSILGTGLSNYIGNYLGISLSKSIIERPTVHYIITMSDKNEGQDTINKVIKEIVQADLSYNICDSYKLDINLNHCKEFKTITIFPKNDKEDKFLDNLVEKYNLHYIDRRES